VGAAVKSYLPARRFREVRLLIGAALILLVIVVVVLVQAMITMGRTANRRAEEDAVALAQLLSAAATMRDPAELVALLPDRWGGVAMIQGERVVSRSGLAGPEEPAWWPWPSRAAWERDGRGVAGPLPLVGERVLVAYRPIDAERAIRVVQPIPTASAAARRRWLGAALGLIVAGGGVLVAWVLIGRLLAPYRDLLAEAARVSRRSPSHAEDRFLVETFRDALRRLEESEAAMRRRADELEVLADVLTRRADGGVVITDAEGRVRAANQVARELTGEGVGEGVALPERIAGGEGRLRLGERTVEVRRLPLTSAGGAPEGEVLFLADLTRLEALERALQEREHMASLGELAAGMAHELRNALATVDGYARLLADADASQQQRYLEGIRNETASVGRLLQRFLAFAQPQELGRERRRLRPLVKESARRLQEWFPALRVEVSGADVEASVDPLAFSVAVENLLRNAVEAGPTGAVVRVEVRQGDEIVQLVVEDEGPGVPPEMVGRLFVPFASTKPSGGIGLALARRLVRLHGGELEYEPTSGPGARFVITIPREGVT
jgi:signal transduction histidine kinase